MVRITVLLLRTYNMLHIPTIRPYTMNHCTEEKYIAALSTDSRLTYSNWGITRVYKYHSAQEVGFSMLGLDTHADISCAGKDAYVTAKLDGRTCSVHPFNDTYEAMTGIEVVNVLLKYQNKDGEEYILELNQCLNFTDTMNHSILCTNQVRHAGVIINDVPKVLDGTSTQDMRLNNNEDIIHLEMNGPIPYIPVSRPNKEDIEWLPRLKLTRDDVEWDPQFIFNEGQKNIHPYLEDDFNISYNIQGLRALNDIVNQHENRIAAITHLNTSKLTGNDLAKLWGIGIKAADRTLKATTQLSTRYLNGKIHRRVRTRMHQRRYRQLWGHLSRFSTDTFQSKVKSLRGNKYFQLFCNQGAFTKSYAMKSRKDAHLALDKFLHEVGIPSELHSDGAEELVHGQWDSICQRHKIFRTMNEPHSPWQNLAERTGGIIKSRARDMMRRTNTPLVLWDYCIEYNSDIRCMTATSIFDLNNRTPFEAVLGFTSDISELVEFGWFQWVWYHNPVDPTKDQIGRWMGPAHNVGQGLAYYILNINAEVVVRSTVSKINDDDITPMDLEERQKLFNDRVNSLIGNFQHASIQRSEQVPGMMDDVYQDLFVLSENDIDDLRYEMFNPEDPNLTKPNAENILINDASNDEINDRWINSSVPMTVGGEVLQGTVKRRKRDGDTGLLVGKANDNPLLDTRVYEVELPDGTYADYHANNLIENIYNSVDNNGHNEIILEDIIDHRATDQAVPRKHGWVRSPQGLSKRVITTKGWELKILWKDGTSTWIPLKDIKESNPIEVA